MRIIFALAACLALVLGFSSDGFARPAGITWGTGLATSAPIVTSNGSTYTIPAGSTVGPQVVGAPYTAVVNNGTINGGTSTGLTTVPTVTSVTNNGTITSSTLGVSMTGSPTATLTNTGEILVSNTAVGANTATASATGIIILSTGP